MDWCDAKRSDAKGGGGREEAVERMEEGRKEDDGVVWVWVWDARKPGKPHSPQQKRVAVAVGCCCR